MNQPLRLAHLYPDHMNLYGDRGNVQCLVSRCRWRGTEMAVTEIGLGAGFDPDGYDLVFMGGGPDREQLKVARDLVSVKGEGLTRAVAEGVVFLVVCGGYQLFGHYYRPAQGEDLPGLGIFDLWTIHPGPQAPRCIGNLVATWQEETLVGFENHGGRTYLGPGAQPLASVVHGRGNNGEDGTEGAVYKHAYGTYLHGSFLPKNPVFADHLIKLALARHGEAIALAPLDDRLEDRAHRAAVQLAQHPRYVALQPPAGPPRVCR